MKKQILIILLGLGVVFSACTTSYDKLLSGTDVSKKYEYALKYFNEKKYNCCQAVICAYCDEYGVDDNSKSVDLSISTQVLPNQALDWQRIS